MDRRSCFSRIVNVLDLSFLIVIDANIVVLGFCRLDSLRCWWALVFLGSSSLLRRLWCWNVRVSLSYDGVLDELVAVLLDELLEFDLAVPC